MNRLSLENRQASRRLAAQNASLSLFGIERVVITSPTIILVSMVFSTLAAVSSAGAGLKVASLSTIATEIAENVGGSAVRVRPLIRAGIDPHDFQPSPRDMQEIEGADLVVLTGKGMEGYLTKLEGAVGGKAKFVDVGAEIPTLTLEEDGRLVEDPHWWHSIANMKKATSVIRKHFVEADPTNKALYTRNAAEYLVKLTDLEKWVRQEIAALPRDRRKLVTSHDALQYFAQEYGFKIYAIEGVSTDDQPSSKKITELIDIIRAQQVKAVFFESVANPKVISEITKETGAKVGGELFVDGLGEKKASTYPDMIRHNVQMIVDNLK
jgi:zinc/manganese transport system substrate-binding protein